MNDAQIAYLNNCINADFMAFWIKDSKANGAKTLQRIIKIATMADEPGQCGLLGTGVGDKDYVALYNVGPDEILITSIASCESTVLSALG